MIQIKIEYEKIVKRTLDDHIQVYVELKIVILKFEFILLILDRYRWRLSKSSFRIITSTY